MAKQSKISLDLERAIDKLLKETMKDETATLTDKVKVIDRAIKLEALKLKEEDAGFGSGFDVDDDE